MLISEQLAQGRMTGTAERQAQMQDGALSADTTLDIAHRPHLDLRVQDEE
ncbi:MAG: hypothetical protein ACXVCT_21260 [Ktedonobacterales bacterium]